MNAAEAAKKAEKVRVEKAAAREKAHKERERQAAAAWRKERAEFFVEFRKEVEEDIAEAVKAGKTHVEIEYLGNCGGADSPVGAEKRYEDSRLRDLVEKVFAHFRGKGFSIKVHLCTSEYYISYDTSDEKGYSYCMGATISWKKE